MVRLFGGLNGVVGQVLAHAPKVPSTIFSLVKSDKKNVVGSIVRNMP